MMKELAKKTLDRANANPLEKRLAKAVIDCNAEIGKLSQENNELKACLRTLHNFGHDFWAKVHPIYQRYRIVENCEDGKKN